MNQRRLPEDFEALPKFQKLQYLFAGHVRDPEHQPYQGTAFGGEAIESRRLQAYESLFYHNVFDFFSNLFPVLKSVLGEARWGELVREYLQKHQSRKPLFHELGQEFILFLQNEYEPQSQDPNFLLELAHYEWVELAVSIDPQEITQNPTGLKVDAQQRYALSPLAWPLAYEWPVHELSAANQTLEKPEGITTLLVYRDLQDQVQFMALSPLLFELLQRLTHSPEQTLQAVLSDMADDLAQDEAQLTPFALQIVQNLLDEHLLHPAG